MIPMVTITDVMISSHVGECCFDAFFYILDHLHLWPGLFIIRGVLCVVIIDQDMQS